MALPTPLDLAPLRTILAPFAPHGRAALLPALHAAQAHYGYISETTATEIAHTLHVPLAEVHGVIEFYSMFYNAPIGRTVIRICTDPACALNDADKALAAACSKLGVAAGETTADGAFTVERSTCLGLCNLGVAANITHEGQNLAAIAGSLNPLLNPHDNCPPDYVGGDVSIITALCGKGRPATLQEYEAAGGMRAFKQHLSPEAVIAEIKASGLVGMGGAAFPTGVKWEGAAKAQGAPKYFVINADESEPGTFKDRILMEQDPCRIIEGALLGARAIGAKKIYFYIRGEYPRALASVQAAVKQFADAGYLTGFDFEVRQGAGAYICGEETALFESIEGKRGFPRIKPPFPITHGLFQKPTVINNVETLAKVPLILADGAAAFRQIGTEKSPGPKLFCVSGDVAKPGLYEVPFGVTLRHLLDLAGGVRGDLQGILFGGAAGAFATEKDLDVKMTFEDLRAAGLPLGSGVVMVFNAKRDMRDVLVRLTRFFAHESCGKCYPCQLGTQRQYEIAQRLANGKLLADDKDRLTNIGWTMTDASICGLGQTAASAVLSAMKVWPELFNL